MITLNLAASFEDASAPPFVTRLTRDGAGGACLAAEFGASQTYQLPGQAFQVNVPEGYALFGDVVFADPQNGRVARWIRASSPHNTLLVMERCDQLCIMCSQPAKKSHTDLFDHLETACLLAPQDMVLGICGGEPLLFKDQVFTLIERIHYVRADLSFHVLTNAQHFAEADLDRLRQPAFRNVIWGVPLYAASATLPDDIVGKAGAQAQLLKGLAIMARAGLSVELRTVLMKRNYGQLPALARVVSARLPFIRVRAVMQLKRAGFARNRWHDQFVDHSAAPGALVEAVSVAHATGIDLSLYNVPYCTVPAGLRGYLSQSISDWKRTYSPDCLECSKKPICSGFFEWHAELSDYATGAPILKKAHSPSAALRLPVSPRRGQAPCWRRRSRRAPIRIDQSDSISSSRSSMSIHWPGTDRIRAIARIPRTGRGRAAVAVAAPIALHHPRQHLLHRSGRRRGPVRRTARPRRRSCHRPRPCKNSCGAIPPCSPIRSYGCNPASLRSVIIPAPLTGSWDRRQRQP